MCSAVSSFTVGRQYWTRLCPQPAASIWSSVALSAGGGGRPPPAGDRGKKERNYQRNQAKKARSEAAQGKEVDMRSLLQNMRQSDSQSQKQSSSLKDVLSEIKFHIPSNEFTRKKMGMHPRSSLTRPEREVPKLKTERRPENSIYPSAGPRLGMFNIPGPDTKILPPSPPNLAERDHVELVASMRRLKPTNQFELDMTEVTFPRQFPIDNETAKEDDEDGVGFEDHVLLNHLLTGFPTRGPVRHFMEMVVTGLSKNPHYTVQEKEEHVQWYRDFFAQFSDEELQAITTKTDSTDTQ